VKSRENGFGQWRKTGQYIRRTWWLWLIALLLVFAFLAVYANLDWLNGP